MRRVEPLRHRTLHEALATTTARSSVSDSQHSNESESESDVTQLSDETLSDMFDALTAQATTPPDASSGVFAHLPDDAKLFAVAFSLSGDPAPGNHPANISDDGAELWNRMLTSKRYIEATKAKKPLQKWAICTRMYLDLCHRKGVTPFRLKKSSGRVLTLSAMQSDYANQFNMASKLAQHITEALDDEQLAKPLDRGVWRYSGVEYRDKRYVVVLETRLQGKQKTPTECTRYLKREQHFEKVDGIPGLHHAVTPNASIRVRTLKFPTISMQMRLTFSKDKLLTLGIESGTAREMLEKFAVCAKAWSRRHVFTTYSTAMKGVL